MLLFNSFETFQLDFLKTYYDETLVGSPKALSLTNEVRQQQVEALQREIEAFFIVPNLLWALWSISQSVSTKITFGYWVSTSSFGSAWHFNFKVVFLFIFVFILNPRINFNIFQISYPLRFKVLYFYFFSVLCRRKDAILLSFQRILHLNEDWSLKKPTYLYQTISMYIFYQLCSCTARVFYLACFSPYTSGEKHLKFSLWLCFDIYCLLKSLLNKIQSR